MYSTNQKLKDINVDWVMYFLDALQRASLICRPMHRMQSSREKYLCQIKRGLMLMKVVIITETYAMLGQ